MTFFIFVEVRNIIFYVLISYIWAPGLLGPQMVMDGEADKESHWNNCKWDFSYISKGHDIG